MKLRFQPQNHEFMKQQTRVPGILGGMGPGATRDFYNWILQLTPAQNDQEHLEMLMHSFPHPDRTEAILGKKGSPLPTLIYSAQLLQKMGADFLAMPCNTAHHFIPDLQKHIRIPILNMIDETGKELDRLGIKKVGLLSTAGTARSGIYQSLPVDVIIPSPPGVQKEMEAIYGNTGIKAGVEHEQSDQNKRLLLEVIRELRLKGAEVIILGCTEISLCFQDKDVYSFINPTKILAQAVIREALQSTYVPDQVIPIRQYKVSLDTLK